MNLKWKIFFFYHQILFYKRKFMNKFYFGLFESTEKIQYTKSNFD